MPVTEFDQEARSPRPAQRHCAAAGQLKYRDFLTVCLIVDKAELFADNWIYVHEPDVKVGRIQNFKNWSPAMVPDQSKTSLGLEYFCNEGDDLWCMSDAELIELGKRELEHIGLVEARTVEDGCVFRVPKSYPVYDSDYRQCLSTLKDFIAGLDNFQTVGRNGLHRYNNQDHAMLTGLYAARNLALGETNDLWNVNVDQEYHEEVREPSDHSPRDERAGAAASTARRTRSGEARCRDPFMTSQPSTSPARSPRLLSAFDPVLAFVAALTLLGLALRAVGSNSELWFDEIYSLVVSSRPPLRELLTTYFGDIQHPLYSVMAHISIAALGETAWTARLPAIVFGVASIPLLFVLGRAVATTHEALLAAALLTVSYHHVWFSQNARGYTVLLFLTLLCTLLFYRGLEKGRWLPFLAYAVAAALGAYTHLTFVFVVVSHAATVLLLAAGPFRNRSAGTRWLAKPITAIVLSGVLTVAFYSPMLPQVISFYLHGTAKMKALSTPSWALFETLRGLQLGFGSQLVVAAGAIFVGCGLWSYWKENRPAFFLLVLPGVVTGLGLVAVLGKLYPRYLFLLAGFAILIVVRGAMVLGAILARVADSRRRTTVARTIGIAAIALMIAVSTASLGRVYGHPKQNFSGAVRFVESERQLTEPVLTAGAAAWPIQHYYERDWPQIKDIKQIESFSRQGGRVWLVYTFPSYIEDETPGLMNAIDRRFKTIRVFPGTLEHGEVFVCVKEIAEPASLLIDL